MPTWTKLRGFIDDYSKLPPTQQAAFRLAVGHFVSDIKSGSFRKGLRVKKLQGHDDIWEMTWAADGRATFTYSTPVRDGEPHVIWRRIGTHDILKRP